jgi:hypothetical protein
MVRKQYRVLELANQMPVRIWIWPEPLVAPRVITTRPMCEVIKSGGVRYHSTAEPGVARFC